MRVEVRVEVRVKVRVKVRVEVRVKVRVRLTWYSDGWRVGEVPSGLSLDGEELGVATRAAKVRPPCAAPCA